MKPRTITLVICALLVVEVVSAQSTGNTGRPGRPTIAAQRAFIFVPQFDFNNSVQGSSGLDVNGSNAVFAYKKLQQRADENYSDGNYQKAYADYLQLAEFNDKYSQYMLGQMYAQGQGVNQDMVEAYAWSYVSAESRQKELVNSHVRLRQQLTPEQLQRGQRQAEKYHKDHGTYALANKARRLVRKGKRNCTGSRLGGSCDRVAASSFNCNSNGQGIPSKECLIFGSIGLPAIAGLQPSDLRVVENHLKDLIKNYNPGRVELGELEIIED